MKLHSIARRGGASLLAVTTSLLAAVPVTAAVINPFTDSFTSVSFTSNFHGSDTTVLDGTLSASTHAMHDAEPNLSLISPGTYHGEAQAHFGSLGARTTISGPGSDKGRAAASYQDFKTITDPAFANGSAGTVQFGFDVDVSSLATPAPGITSVSGEFSAFAISVVAGENFDSFMSHSQKFPLGTAIDSTAGSPGGLVTAAIPFIYGEPFLFRTVFTVFADLDTHFVKQHSNPFFLEYRLGTIESLTTHGFNTAELSTIIVNGMDNPNTIVMGQSGSDYTQLVAGNPGGAVPPPTGVPEPSTMWLSLLALGPLHRRRRPARTSR